MAFGHVFDGQQNAAFVCPIGRDTLSIQPYYSSPDVRKRVLDFQILERLIVE